MAGANVGQKLTNKAAQIAAKKAAQKVEQQTNKATQTLSKESTNVSTGNTVTRSSLTSNTNVNANSGSVSTTSSNGLTKSTQNLENRNKIDKVLEETDTEISKKALLSQPKELEPNLANKNVVTTEKTQKINTQNKAIDNNVEPAVKSETPQVKADDVNGINNEKILEHNAGLENSNKIDNFNAKLDQVLENTSKVSVKKTSGLGAGALVGGALIGTAIAMPTLMDALSQPGIETPADDVADPNGANQKGNENDNLLINQNDVTKRSDSQVDNSTGDLDKYLNPDGNIDSTLFVPGASGAGSDGYIGGGTVYAQSDGYGDDSSYSSGDNSGIPAMIRDWVDNAVETIQENPVPTAIIAAIVIIIIASLAKNKKKGKKGAVKKTALPMKAKAGGKKA